MIRTDWNTRAGRVAPGDELRKWHIRVIGPAGSVFHSGHDRAAAALKIAREATATAERLGARIRYVVCEREVSR